MKYIDADKLKAEIEKQMESIPRETGRGAGTITSTGYGMMQAFQIMCSIIASLQHEQQEVDLEKVLSGFTGYYAHENSGEYPSAIDIARHFFELGKNSK